VELTSSTQASNDPDNQASRTPPVGLPRADVIPHAGHRSTLKRPPLLPRPHGNIKMRPHGLAFETRFGGA
jgi:hypothetical protein